MAAGNRTIRERVVEEIMKEVESSLREGKLGLIMQERVGHAGAGDLLSR